MRFVHSTLKNSSNFRQKTEPFLVFQTLFNVLCAEIDYFLKKIQNINILTLKINIRISLLTL